MNILYIREGCPFCEKVLSFIVEKGIKIDIKSIMDEENQKMLLDKGGRQQVPFLLNEEEDTAIYEANDIIDHLKKSFLKTLLLKEKGTMWCPFCYIPSRLFLLSRISFSNYSSLQNLLS